MSEDTNIEVDPTVSNDYTKRIIEGLLFSSCEPITVRRIKDAMDEYHTFTNDEVKQLITELGEEYAEQNRAFQIEEIGRGYILRTCEEFGPYIHKLLKTARTERLSHAGAEVLAIIAYKQPITRPQIDEIRGVDSSGIVHTLIEKQLVEATGKLEVPGRPTLYGVTHHFLKHFGLKDLKELPSFGIVREAIVKKEKQVEDNMIENCCENLEEEERTKEGEDSSPNQEELVAVVATEEVPTGEPL